MTTKHTVTVQVQPTTTGELARVQATVEGKEDGGTWKKVDARVQVAEGLNASVDYELEDGQRLIIESQTLQRVVMDKDQSAAILAPASDVGGSETLAKNEEIRQKNIADAKEAEEKAKKPKQPPGTRRPEDIPMAAPGSTKSPLTSGGQTGRQSATPGDKVQGTFQGTVQGDHPAPGGARDSHQVKKGE